MFSHLILKSPCETGQVFLPQLTDEEIESFSNYHPIKGDLGQASRSLSRRLMSSDDIFWWSNHEIRKKNGSFRVRETPNWLPSALGFSQGELGEIGPFSAFPSSTPWTPLGSLRESWMVTGKTEKSPQWAGGERRALRGEACWSGAGLGWEPAWTKKLFQEPDCGCCWGGREGTSGREKKPSVARWSRGMILA